MKRISILLLLLTATATAYADEAADQCKRDEALCNGSLCRQAREDPHQRPGAAETCRAACNRWASCSKARAEEFPLSSGNCTEKCDERVCTKPRHDGPCDCSTTEECEQKERQCARCCAAHKRTVCR